MKYFCSYILMDALILQVLYFPMETDIIGNFLPFNLAFVSLSELHFYLVLIAFKLEASSRARRSARTEGELHGLRGARSLFVAAGAEEVSAATGTPQPDMRVHWSWQGGALELRLQISDVGRGLGLALWDRLKGWNPVWLHLGGGVWLPIYSK